MGTPELLQQEKSQPMGTGPSHSFVWSKRGEDLYLPAVGSGNNGFRNE
jgi:hypothetical protein